MMTTNEKAVKSWWRGGRTLTGSRALLCLLMLLLVWHLAGVGYQTSQSLKLSIAQSDDVCELDSSSKPSIAAAILKQEAGRLFSAYIQQEDLKQAAELGPGSVQQPRQPASQHPPGPDQDPSDGCSTAAALEAPALQPLARLREEAQELNIDLDRKLLKVYYENHLWDAYLDCYLEMLQGVPENPVVLTWARTALLISQKSGRTDEIVDAMRHVTRFRREAKTARGLTSMVEQWEAKNPRAFEVGTR